MSKTTIRKVMTAAATTVLICAVGGCAANLTPDTALQDMLDLLVQSADPALMPDASQAGKSDTSTAPDTTAFQADQLLQELEAVLAGYNPGTAGDALNSLVTALAGVAGNSVDAATSQPTTLVHPLRQLRNEIHTLRHSLTRDQAAQLLLSALAASSTSGAAQTSGSDSSGSDLLTQVQNLLATLRGMNQ
jgi:hypothetical protein